MTKKKVGGFGGCPSTPRRKFLLCSIKKVRAPFKYSTKFWLPRLKEKVDCENRDDFFYYFGHVLLAARLGKSSLLNIATLRCFYEFFLECVCLDLAPIGNSWFKNLRDLAEVACQDVNA